MPLLLLFVVFVIVPIAELYVIIQVGQEIGVLPTIGLLIADSLLGSWLVRSQGRLAWRRFQAALREGRPPTREVLDGALIILGGAFLLTPGFLTDVLGLALLLPPSRAFARGVLTRNVFARAFVAAGSVNVRRRPPAGRGDVVEGEAVEIDPRRIEP